MYCLSRSQMPGLEVEAVPIQGREVGVWEKRPQHLCADLFLLQFFLQGLSPSLSRDEAVEVRPPALARQPPRPSFKVFCGRHIHSRLLPQLPVLPPLVWILRVGGASEVNLIFAAAQSKVAKLGCQGI